MLSLHHHVHNPKADLPVCSAQCTIKFGLKLDVSVLEWTNYGGLFKDERPQWKQSLNDKTTHCYGKRMVELCLSVCVCVCVCERERERERESEREREREISYALVCLV